MPGENHSEDPGDLALQWLVRIHSGRVEQRDLLAYAEWRAASPAHEEAAREAEKLWEGIGAVGKDVGKRVRRRQVTRRGVIGGAGVIMIGAGLYGAGLVGPDLLADYRTAIGERLEFQLQDGSRVFLNADSALSIDMRGDRRRLRLWQGQATFTVAHDAARPFIVRAEGGETRAIGTVFDVDIRRDTVVVTVLEGTVGVHSLDGPGPETIISADQSVSYGMAGSVSAVAMVDAETETAWRRGRLVFDSRPLGDVIAEVSRHLDGNIVVASHRARQMPVTGSFSLTQPEKIVEIVENTLPIKVTRLPFATIIR